MTDPLRKLDRYQDWALLGLRLAVAAVFMYHGHQKWALWGAEPSAQMGEGMLYLMRFLSVVEPLGGLALALGFLTRWAGLGFAIIMLGAIHTKVSVWGIGFASSKGTGWEFDLVLLAAALLLMAAGAGRLALDRVLMPSSQPKS